MFNSHGNNTSNANVCQVNILQISVLVAFMSFCFSLMPRAPLGKMNKNNCIKMLATLALSSTNVPQQYGKSCPRLVDMESKKSMFTILQVSIISHTGECATTLISYIYQNPAKEEIMVQLSQQLICSLVATECPFTCREYIVSQRQG